VSLGDIPGRELADRRRLAGAVDPDDEQDRRAALRRGTGRPVRVARDQQVRELGADRRFRTARVTAAAGTLHEVDGQGGTDVTGDERFLDVVPLRIVAAEETAELAHEPGARSFQALVEGVGRSDGEECGRIERRVHRSFGIRGCRRGRRWRRSHRRGCGSWRLGYGSCRLGYGSHRRYGGYVRLDIDRRRRGRLIEVGRVRLPARRDVLG
jgi:hypothetical protein